MVTFQLLVREAHQSKTMRNVANLYVANHNSWLFLSYSCLKYGKPPRINTYEISKLVAVKNRNRQAENTGIIELHADFSLLIEAM